MFLLKMEKQDYFHKYLNRCIPLLTEKGVEKLRSSCVAIAGCGGVGGAAAVTLARMGVSNFKLADPGIFDEPDINRQWAANVSNLGKNKTDAYEETLKNINPEISVKKYPEGLTETNLSDFLNGADLVIDCLDVAVKIELRARLFRQAREIGIYSITAPILGFGTIFCCSSPTGMSMDRIVGMIGRGSSGEKFPNIFRKIFMPEHLDIIESKIATHEIPSVPISPMISASIIATESILILLGKLMPGSRKPLCLPKVLAVDLFRLSYFLVDIETIPLDQNEEKNK